jgi:hypothetical protein
VFTVAPPPAPAPAPAAQPPADGPSPVGVKDLPSSSAPPDTTLHQTEILPGLWVTSRGSEPAHVTLPGLGSVDVAPGQALNLTLPADVQAQGKVLQGVTGDGIGTVGVAVVNDPLAAGEVVAGAALTVAGVVTGGVVSAAGVALIAKGGVALANDVSTIIDAHDQAHASATAAWEKTKATQAAAVAAAATGGASSPAPAFWQAFTRRR